MMIDAYNYHDKQQLRNNYEISKLIAYFVNVTMSGKEVPSINAVYPNIFEDNKEEDVDEATIKYYEKQFAMLAASVNSSRKEK